MKKFIGVFIAMIFLGGVGLVEGAKAIPVNTVPLNLVTIVDGLKGSIFTKPDSDSDRNYGVTRIVPLTETQRAAIFQALVDEIYTRSWRRTLKQPMMKRFVVWYKNMQRAVLPKGSPSADDHFIKVYTRSDPTAPVDLSMGAFFLGIDKISGVSNRFNTAGMLSAFLDVTDFKKKTDSPSEAVLNEPSSGGIEKAASVVSTAVPEPVVNPLDDLKTKITSLKTLVATLSTSLSAVKNKLSDVQKKLVALQPPASS